MVEYFSKERIMHMGTIAIVTDSNSGITQAAAKELGIRVLPMPFYINDELFFEDITLTQEAFYQKLAEDADISTSQPAPGDVTGLWDELLQSYDQIVYIPMSSGLSNSCETAMMLAGDYPEKVFVADNQRISITQRQSVLDALELAKAGCTAREIYDTLMRERLEAGSHPPAQPSALSCTSSPCSRSRAASWTPLPRPGAGSPPRKSCWTPWSGT